MKWYKNKDKLGNSVLVKRWNYQLADTNPILSYQIVMKDDTSHTLWLKKSLKDFQVGTDSTYFLLLMLNT